MPTVRYRVNFGKAKRERYLKARRARSRRDTGPVNDEVSPAATADDGPTSTALHLAAAYKIERMLASGEIRGFKEAADFLGGSPSWVSHIMNLLNLRPEIQEAVLAGEAMPEEKLKRAARNIPWEEQDPLGRSTTTANGGLSGLFST